MDKPHDEQPDQRKIIVDEDWKAQVEAEKERYRRERETQRAESSAGEQGPLPPASLTALATTLGTEAMIALGLIQNPITRKTEVNLEHARYLIDTLGVLQEKTKGNLTPEEAAVLDNLLHELRLGYFSVHQQTQAGEGAS